MNIIMMVDKFGKCPNSTRVMTYKKDSEYNVPEECPEKVAGAFLRERWAIEAGTEKLKADPPGKLRKNPKTKRRHANT